MFLRGQKVAIEKITRGNINGRCGEIIEGAVTCVGKKYYTVKTDFLEYKFDKETLLEHSKYSPSLKLFCNAQAIYDDRERNATIAEIVKVIQYNRQLSLEKVRRIKSILDEEEEL